MDCLPSWLSYQTLFFLGRRQLDAVNDAAAWGATLASR
jgi:hypothetical protein